MYKTETAFGIVFITGKMYIFYKIVKTGEHYQHHKILNSTVRLPKKQKKGGQSAQRFCRIRNNEEAAYIKKVGEKVIECFMNLENGKSQVEKLIFAGPSSKKDKLKEDPLVKQYYSNIQVINTSDLTDSVIFHTLSNTKELFETNITSQEDDTLLYIKELLEAADDSTVYGVNEVNSFFGSLRLVITDEETLPLLRIDAKCGIKIVNKEKLNKIVGTIGVKWY